MLEKSSIVVEQDPPTVIESCTWFLHLHDNNSKCVCLRAREMEFMNGASSFLSFFFFQIWFTLCLYWFSCLIIIIHNWSALVYTYGRNGIMWNVGLSICKRIENEGCHKCHIHVYVFFFFRLSFWILHCITLLWIWIWFFHISITSFNCLSQT